MKNKIYYLGIVACCLVLLASMFKLMHLPGAGIFLTTSFALLVLVFFPLAFINSWKSGGRKKLALYIAAFVTLFFNFSGALFKIMHWSGANILLFPGMLSPVLIFLPVYLYFHIREKEESLKDFLYIIFFLVCLSGMGTLIALKPSQNLLKDITRLNYATSLSDYYEIKSATALKSHEDVKTDITVKTNALIEVVNSVKTELVTRASNRNLDAIGRDNEIHLWRIRNMDNIVLVNDVLVNDEEGINLVREIENYHTYLTSIPAIRNSKSFDAINALLDVKTGQGKDENDPEKDWFASGTFLIVAILRLTEMENNICMAGEEALSALALAPVR